jgi:hypothetical protein
VDLAAFPQTEGAADRRTAAKDRSDRSRESRLRGKEGSATSHAESATPAGGISEPGVLQGSGDAALDVRQAACDRMRQEFAQHIAVPRGCLTETLALLEAHKIRPEVRDERYAGTAIEAVFQGQLRPFQEEAVAKITAHDEGILCAPTAFGKTAVAAWLIAKRKVNTLVVVHRQQLLDQWQERLGRCSWIYRQIDRAYRRWKNGPDGLRRCRRHPKSVPERRSEGLRG